MSYGLTEVGGWFILNRDLFESELVRSVLVAGLSDWVDLGLVYHLTEYLGADPADRRLMTVAATLQVVAVGLMLPGDVGDEGFVLWPGETSELLSRLIRGFNEADTRFRPGDVAWLANTASGDTFALEVSGE